jgi:DNA-binding CsgD family transcriptional regulator
MIRSAHNPFTQGREEHTERLLTIVSRWWEGWSLRKQARVLGISHTRIRYMLRHAGCDERLRRGARLQPGPRGFRNTTLAGQERAFEILSRSHTGRLPAQQRGVLAWTALGLPAPEISRRLGLSPAKVRNLLLSADRPARKRVSLGGIRIAMWDPTEGLKDIRDDDPRSRLGVGRTS